MDVMGWGRRAFWLLGGIAVAVPVVLWALSSDDGSNRSRAQSAEEKPTPPEESEPPAAAEESQVDEPASEPQVAEAAPDPEPQPAEPEVASAAPLAPLSDALWVPSQRASQGALGDLRRWRRVPFSREVQVDTPQGRIRAVAHNIGPNGLRVCAQGGHETSPWDGPGELVVWIDSERSLRAQVAWSRINEEGREEAGLLFVDTFESGVRERLSGVLREAGWGEEHAQQRRSQRRFQLELPVQLQDTREKRHPGGLLNLATGGAAFRSAHGFKVGEQLGLLVPTGKKKAELKLPSQVVEIRGDLYHVKFLTLPAGLRKRLETFLQASV